MIAKLVQIHIYVQSRKDNKLPEQTFDVQTRLSIGSLTSVYTSVIHSIKCLVKTILCTKKTMYSEILKEGKNIPPLPGHSQSPEYIPATYIT